MTSQRRRTTSFTEKDEEKKPDMPVAGVTVQSNSTGEKVITVIARCTSNGNRSAEVSYTNTKVIGNGSFGVVFQVELTETQRKVAVKKVLQDRRFKNRELDIMLTLKHQNIVDLLYYFYSKGSKKDEVYLNLMMEYLPETLYQVIRRHSSSLQRIPIFNVKLYMYQAMRGAAYLHAAGICHRDFKPQNMLVDAASGVLKLCDFGSAKILVAGQPNVSYICSRYYRAPELIFGATEYSCKIDIWSLGCVFGELLLGSPLFPGETGVDQLVEIVKRMGSPSQQQVNEMSAKAGPLNFPRFKAKKWSDVFKKAPHDATDLISQMLVYVPKKRLEAVDCLTHSFFKDLKKPESKMEGKPLPELFNFTSDELKAKPDLMSILVPRHMQVSV